MENEKQYYDCCSQCGWETSDPEDSHECEIFLEFPEEEE